MENKELLLEFLSCPLNSGDLIYEKFSALPGAISKKGEKPYERYVYIPGARKDRVVLTAHIDTVWDKDYTELGGCKVGEHEIIFEDGVFRSGNVICGIGADDRAGCAMLWKLRDSGHSILLLDGEEDGKRGAWFLRKSSPGLYKELNRHSFMIALDHIGTNHVSFKQVDNTEKFKAYFTEKTGFVDHNISGGCDLQVIAQTVCGANVGVGYHECHSSYEFLNLAEWENTYEKLRSFLALKQPRLKTTFKSRAVKLARGSVGKTLRALKLKK